MSDAFSSSSTSPNLSALRVSPPGSVMVLAIRREGDWGVVEVRDSGPGLTDDDISVANDDKLSSGLKAEPVTDLFGNHDLALGREGGRRGICHKRAT